MFPEGRGPGATSGRAIFLHGYPGHPTEFVSLATQLDTSCELLEMPWLDGSASKLALMDIVTALGRDFLEAPTHIVGHDLGAVIGWFLAHLAPQNVQSLTMIGTPRLDVYQENLKQLGARGYLDYQQVLANHNTDSPLPDDSVEKLENSARSIFRQFPLQRQSGCHLLRAGHDSRSHCKAGVLADPLPENLYCFSAGRFFSDVQQNWSFSTQSDQMELAGAETEDVHLAKRLSDNRSLTNPLAISSLYRSLAVCPIPPRDDVRGVPLLNIMGGKDPYFPSEILEDSSYPYPLGVNTVILENAGHWSHHTHTTSCKSAINRFWKAIA